MGNWSWRGVPFFLVFPRYPERPPGDSRTARVGALFRRTADRARSRKSLGSPVGFQKKGETQQAPRSSNSAEVRAHLPRPRVFVEGALPSFAAASFDCVTCGYVLEHLPLAKVGLAELSRVISPGGRMLLLTSEDTFSGAMTSRVWCCRTYNRR